MTIVARCSARGRLYTGRVCYSRGELGMSGTRSGISTVAVLYCGCTCMCLHFTASCTMMEVSVQIRAQSTFGAPMYVLAQCACHKKNAKSA